jgi:hypothetical protein
VKPLSVVLPPKSAVQKQLLKLLLARHPRRLTTQEAYDHLAEAMGLTSEQRWSKRTTASGEENAWDNRVRQASRTLVAQGFLHHWTEAGRGDWSLSNAGVKYAKHPNPRGLIIENDDDDVDF